MNPAFNYPKPSIRVQPSIPTSYSRSATVVEDGSASSVNPWRDFDDGGGGEARYHQSAGSNARRHRASASTSSAASNGSGSQRYGHAPTYQSRPASSPPTSATYPIDSSSMSISTHDDESKGFSKHLPTPTHTPTHEPFLATSFHNFNPQVHPDSTTLAAHLAMKQALLDHHSSLGLMEEDTPGFTHSGRHSVSSYEQSPATPLTVYEDFADERFKASASTGEIESHEFIQSWMEEYLRFDDEPDVNSNSSNVGVGGRQTTVPKFERTMTEIYADELYNPMDATSAPPPPPPQPSQSRNGGNSLLLLSPYRNVVNELLHAANEARCQSPADSATRAVSPFRNGSPLAPLSYDNSSSHMRMASATSAREQQKSQADAFAMKRQHEESRAKDDIATGGHVGLSSRAGRLKDAALSRRWCLRPPTPPARQRQRALPGSDAGPTVPELAAILRWWHQRSDLQLAQRPKDGIVATAIAIRSTRGARCDAG